ncbi:MAG TPA: alpha/beta-hydrolase N-terminal domain-containing protein, partial [Sphingomonas sp.]|nr:alpha/beta-hydrolase N-terminal domain-containing protein [Sphingomonas sp.]
MELVAQSLRARFAPISLPGLIWGTLFFAASLTPSMMPRHFVLQGALSGLSFSLGYGMGVLLERLWAYVQLPVPGPNFVRRATQVSGLLCLAVAVTFLWLATGWQNSVRTALQLPLVASASPLFIGIVAAITFWLLRAIAWLVGRVFHIIARWLKRHMPARAANTLGVVLAGLLCLSVLDGLVFRLALSIADSSYRELDALIQTDIAPPVDPMRTGSAASLVDWQDLGRMGREFIDSGPSRASIAAVTGAPAGQPIRVYAGLNSAPTPRARAGLALEELKRVGAFDKPVLVIIMPTGTGWVDPAAIDTLEYLHRG